MDTGHALANGWDMSRPSQFHRPATRQMMMEKNYLQPEGSFMSL
jgi:hypothetical protein